MQNACKSLLSIKHAFWIHHFYSTFVPITINENILGIHKTIRGSMRYSSIEGSRNKPLSLEIPQMVAQVLLISILLTQ